MHYYQWNIGDYRRDASHLTMLEHGAYRQLLDSYYLTEKPLPLDDAILMRTHCARTADEVQAIKNVLSEFFVKTDDGWVHRRCDKVISGFHEKSDKAKKSASVRWEKEKSQDYANALQSNSEGNANHKPITNNQEPLTNNKNTLVADAIAPTTPDCPHQEILDLYHEILPTLSQVRLFTDQRKKQLRARWRENVKHQSLDFWRKYFDHVSRSDFLMGRSPPTNGRTWQADFDFLTTASKFVCVIEGKYHV